MAGIAALVDLGDQPLDPLVVERVRDSIVRRGPDGTDAWQGAHVALIHAHFWTTPEELGERQPIVGGGGRLALAADARLDDRDGLMAALGSARPPGEPSDAQLILAAYEKWGEDCAAQLVGDFAFAIWDGSANRLFCARDPAGIRTLHYARAGSLLIVASGVDAVLAGLGGSAPVNEPLLVDMVNGHWERWVTETAYLPISRLPQGYALTAEGGVLRTRRYWTYGAARPAGAPRSRQEYVEEFRHLLDLSVRARLRSVGTPSIMVSGGIDSSSITALAGRAASQGRNPPAHLYTFTFDATPGSDEREYLTETLERWPQLPVTFVPSDDSWALREYGDDAGYALSEPDPNMFRALLLGVFRAVRRNGSTVVVSGHGGDETLISQPYHLLPYLWRDLGLRDWKTELPYFWASSKRRGTQWLVKTSVRDALRPLFDRPTMLALRRRVIDGPLPAASRDREPLSDPFPPPALPTRAAELVYEGLHDGLAAVRRVGFYELAGYAGIDWRFPYYDRRVVEFALHLPRPLMYQRGSARAILREAMTGLLPERVRTRKSKTAISGLVDRGLLEKETSRFETLVAGYRGPTVGAASAAGVTAAAEAYRTGRSGLDPRVTYAIAIAAWKLSTERSGHERRRRDTGLRMTGLTPDDCGDRTAHSEDSLGHSKLSHGG
jgi:asparagine synthase (glutamine-hydrolysing)